MKIDDEAVSASTSTYTEMPPASANLLKNILNSKNTDEFIAELNKGRDVHPIMGKTELCRWITVLNKCDEILEKAVTKDENGEMICDSDTKIKKHVISVIRFTVLLFECTSSRRVYRSMDRILSLMETTDLETLAEVLRLLQTMGKRSKYLVQRLSPADQRTLVHNLTAIAQCWGAKLRNLKMAECVKHDLMLPTLFPFTFTDAKQRSINVEKPKQDDSIAHLVEFYSQKIAEQSQSMENPEVSKEDRYCLLARLRMLNGFNMWKHRFRCLLVRLLSISALMYCRCFSTESTVLALFSSGFVEDLVSLLKTEKVPDCNKEYSMLDTIHSEALSTLCSIVSHENSKESKITRILDALSAGSYHGYLSVLTRQVVNELKNKNLERPGKPSIGLSTSLFSLIYHLASIEPGGEKLVESGLTQTLLSVIDFHELPLNLITFGTRCARIIDLFTTIDVSAFKTHNGMEICVRRIVHEIDECRKEQPYMIDTSFDCFDDQEMETEKKCDEDIKGGPWIKTVNTGLNCHQQRSGLIKGLLTFVKRAIQDPQFSDCSRSIMDGGLPEALMHILSNAEYYSPSLFHQASQLISNFVYQNPEELSSLQRRHVPFVLFQSMLRKELPNNRDVISTIGNVFTAMCLNERGLKQFQSYEPFDQIFRILLSVKYLMTMKKKRTEIKTAQSIGSALDDLLRHYPALRPNMLKAIMNVLDRLLEYGYEPPENTEVVMTLAKNISKNLVIESEESGSSVTGPLNLVVDDVTSNSQDQATPVPQQDTPQQADGDAIMEEAFENEEESDVDEEAEMSMDEMSGEGIVSTNGDEGDGNDRQSACAAPTEDSDKKMSKDYAGLEMVCDDGNGRKILPLGDYMLIAAKIFETLMNQPTNVKMIDEFINLGGIEKMMELCQLSCLNNEISLSTFSQSIANIVKFTVLQRQCSSAGRLMNCVMSVFVKTIEPLVSKSVTEFPSLNKAEEEKSPSASMMIHLGDKLIVDTLTNLNNIMPILLIISKCTMGNQFQAESRHRIFESWQSVQGQKLYMLLRKLSRMLVWETSLIKVIKPPIRSCATQTEGEMLAPIMEENEVRVSIMDELCGREEKVEPNETAWISSGISQEEHDYWIQRKHSAILVMKTSKNVSELLTTFCRSINVVSNRRTRRNNDTTANTTLMPAAAKCSLMIFEIIYQDLKWKPNVTMLTPMSLARITEIILQLSNALFDERGKVSSRTNVRQFYESGCHNAFFQLFIEELVPAMNENPVRDFLELTMIEWCRLASRLVNRDCMAYDAMQSVTKERSEFRMDKYMKLVYVDIFKALRTFFEKISKFDNLELWQELCDNAFVVFKDVIKNLESEKIDVKADEKKKEEEREPTTSSNTISIDENTVTRLMDLGFPRPNVMRALFENETADEAAEFLIRTYQTRPSEFTRDGYVTPIRVSDLTRQRLEIENHMMEMMERNENDGNEGSSNSGPNDMSQSSQQRQDEEKVEMMEEEEDKTESKVLNLNDVVLDEDISLQSACEQLIPLIKQLICVSKDLIFSCAELIGSVYDSLSSTFRKDVIVGSMLTKDLSSMIKTIMRDVTNESVDVTPQMQLELASRLHLACLLFDKTCIEYIPFAKEENLAEVVISFLFYCEARFTTVPKLQEVVLPHAILWVDLFDKHSQLLRRMNVVKEMSDNLQWSRLTEDSLELVVSRRREKKWTPYDSYTNKVINNAFFALKNEVRLPGIHDYPRTINFNIMKHCEGETVRNSIKAEFPPDVSIDLKNFIAAGDQSSWDNSKNLEIVELIVKFFAKGTLTSLCSQSLLSLCYRMTIKKDLAKKFVELGGLEHLLTLRSITHLNVPSHISLIIRNCIEDDDMISHAIEKTIKSVVSVSNSTRHAIFYLMSNNHQKQKDWFETVSRLMPLGIRAPNLFMSLIEKKTKMTENNMIEMIQKDKELTDTSSPAPKTPSETCKYVVTLLVREILEGNFAKDGTNNVSRIIGKDKIMFLLSEMLKSYPHLASLVCEPDENADKTVIFELLEKFITTTNSENEELFHMLKNLISTITMFSNSVKIHESVVEDVKYSLIRLCNRELMEVTEETKEKGSTNGAKKVSDLCQIIIMMCSSASLNSDNLRRERPSQIMKLFHKKKICNDLVKAITYLKLANKEETDTVNQILSTLEVLMDGIEMSHSVRHGSRAMSDAAILRREVAGLSSARDFLLRARITSTRNNQNAGGVQFVMADTTEQNEAEENNENANEDQPMEVAANELDQNDIEMVDESPEVNDQEERNEQNGEDEEEEEDDDDDDDEDDDDDDEDNEDEEDEDEADQLIIDDEDREVEEALQDATEPGARRIIDEDEDGWRNLADVDDYELLGEDYWDSLTPFVDNVFPYSSSRILDRASNRNIRDFLRDDWDILLRNRRNPMNTDRTVMHPLMSQESSNQDSPSRARNSTLITFSQRSNLQRQNAIRQSNVLFDAHVVRNTFRALEVGNNGTENELPMIIRTQRNVNQPEIALDRFLGLPTRSNIFAPMRGPTTDRRRMNSFVPSYLDRLEAYSILDGMSIRFFNVVASSYMARIQRNKYGHENPTEEGKSTDDIIVEDRGDSIVIARPSATGTTITVSGTTAPNASRSAGEETSTTQAVENQSYSAAPVEQENEGNAGEAMECGDEENRLPQSSAATAASSVAGTDELEEEQERAPANEEEATTEQPAPPEETSVQQNTSSIPDEYREILGDIEIPEGVDPAFLVALPEDMRADVIRDYQRQQRVERASRSVVAPPAAPAQDNEQPAAEERENAEGAEQSNDPRPVIEPISQEFLNALPPDIQEEILAEHDRAVREATEAMRRANAPPAQPAEPEMDGAAVIASLPVSERTQVLAEMDESDLARLPPAMQDEARRARARHDTHLFRYQRLMFRRNGRGQRNQSTIGLTAGTARQASTKAVHLLDHESIMTLCMLYLLDDRIALDKLQKVLRSACVNSDCCDFIIWSLLAILEKASEISSDGEEITTKLPEWLDSITVSGVGLFERALRVSENAEKVSIHSIISVRLCRHILDILDVIAKSYPGNFLPLALRNKNPTSPTVEYQPVPTENFWKMVLDPSKVPSKKEWSAADEQKLEQCAIAQLLMFLSQPIIHNNDSLHGRILKVSYEVFKTIPHDAEEKLKLNSSGYLPMNRHLKLVINTITNGIVCNEGLKEGLNFLAESMRVFNDSTANFIYELLFSAVYQLGKQLEPQVNLLIRELDEAQTVEDNIDAPEPVGIEGSSKSVGQPLVVDTTNGGRSAQGRFDGERVVIDGDHNARLMLSSCKELQLPAITALTDKSGAQYNFLSALQTLVKVRNHMKQIRKDKKKRKEKEKEKEKSKQKEKDDSNNKEEKTKDDEDEDVEPKLSQKLAGLNQLWDSLSECLKRLGKASDPHAVLALQPAAEAFFLVFASNYKKTEVKRKESETATNAPTTSSTNVAPSPSFDNAIKLEDMDADTSKLIEFAEKHRHVLNQALRQNNAVLSSSGPFAILTHFPKLLDFDVKRKFFRKELNKLDPNYRRNDVTVQVNRSRVFSDSFRELFRLRPAEWKNRFYVIFQGEEGQDAGGLLREWYSVITREIFNPNYALFITAPGDMVTYMINKASYINPEHLDYFKFVGRLIAKSIFDHKYLDCYFTRAFYKHILNLPVRYQDIESEDPAFFKSLEFLLENPIDDLGLDLTFSTEVEEFGVRSVRDLKPNGRKIEVTDANKDEYVKLVCQMKMTGSIRKQLDAFLQGFYEIIPKELITMFNEQELELLISGLPTVDIDDLAANTEYKGYQKNSAQIQWFWRALRSFEKEDKAKFLQFVTGTSKVPLQGFASLEGMNGVQKFSIHMDTRGGDRLPAAHTCFNQIDLPQYESYDKLKDSLLLAVRECTEGFGFA